MNRPIWRGLRASLLLILLAAGKEAWSASVASRGAEPLSILDANGEEVGWYTGSYALLIGNSKYTHGWQSLESIPGELTTIEAVLMEQGFVVEKTLDADSERLRRTFKSFIDRYGYEPKNRLLFFFAGHGYSREDGDKAYLVPVDAPRPSSNERGFLAKALSMQQIETWAREIEAQHALFLFDSCFSGGIFKVRSDFVPPPHIAAELMRPVRQFISAGSAHEVVPARSVFAPLVVKALRGAADSNHDSYVTGTELGQYLREKVIQADTGQTPQFGKIRDPELDEGDFVFALGAKRKPTTITTDTSNGNDGPEKRDQARPDPQPEDFKPFLLRAGTSHRVAALRIDLALEFGETLGLRHATIVVSAPGEAMVRLPVLASGETRELKAGGRSYQLHVLGLDEVARSAEIKIVPISSP